MDDELKTGTGLLFPLVREHGDYAIGTGATLIKSNIRNVLGVRSASRDGAYRGELPWRLSFGAQVDRARHSNLDDEIQKDLIRVNVSDSVARWEPRAIPSPGDIELQEIVGGRRAKLTVTFHVDTGQLGDVSTESVEVLVD